MSMHEERVLRAEHSNMPMHVGSVMIFDKPDGGFDYEDLVTVVGNRVAYVPRYRQIVYSTGLPFTGRFWVDDPEFDLSYHVRRAALPRPGNRYQLEQFVSRVAARTLDRDHPLWEIYLVEGLENDRFAVITKSHEALVDGDLALDITQVIVDTAAGAHSSLPSSWRAKPKPQAMSILMDDSIYAIRHPMQSTIDAVKMGVEVTKDLMRTVSNVMIDPIMELLPGKPPHPSLPHDLGRHRSFAMLDLSLSQLRQIRNQANSLGSAEVTVNDVILAVVAGGLRSWLMSRGEALEAGTVIPTHVPVAVASDGGSGTNVTAHEVNLPVGEANAWVRLHQVMFALGSNDRSQAMRAAAIASIPGFSAATWHSLGARMSHLSNRNAQLVVTNVPGPSHSMYLSSAPMQAAYPVIPLASEQMIALGFTSTGDQLSLGINADRKAVPDMKLLSEAILSAIAELSVAVAERA